MAKPKGQVSTKPPGTAISARNGQRAILTEPGERFDPPAHIERPEALEAWEQYWEDPISSVVTVADHSLLNRWIDMVDRYYRMVEIIDEEPVIESKNNGMTLHPLYKAVLSLGNQIEHLEIKLGIGPKSRHSLGIQIVGAAEAAGRAGVHIGRLQPAQNGALDDEDDPRTAG